ncbi:hypothetical protein [Endozoicomonas sp. ONNA2]|uniref:hypothetical protein n=1 Tax=Endozoicomonas sp. ONNA2 TaxID=2828741 RepID=UPI0021474204|nr:hypothetical protein [Endozoicomonas sp. ONNA2]
MSHNALNMFADVFAQMRELPADLRQDLPVLLVNRKGDHCSAFMRTENIIGHAEPGKNYRLTWQGLAPEPMANAAKPLPAPVTPSLVNARGEWIKDVDLTTKDANILGGMGSFFLPDGEEELVIPRAQTTREHLAFYGCQLIKVGEQVSFDSTGNLPVTITSIGEQYVDSYLMDQDKGGGTYLEVHDRPHLHMPLNKDAGGYLIIGRHTQEGDYLMSAFQVPFGYAIVMAPWVIHSDAYLVGRYLVIYSATPEFSTVIIRRKNGDLAPIRFSGSIH